jgi:hypothetical protein
VDRSAWIDDALTLMFTRLMGIDLHVMSQNWFISHLLYASWIMSLSSIRSTRNRNSEVHKRLGETIFVTHHCWLDETIPNPIQRWIVYGIGSAHNQTLHVPIGLTFVIVTKVHWLREAKAISAGIRSSKPLSSPPHPMFALHYGLALLRFGSSRRKGIERRNLLRRRAA